MLNIITDENEITQCQERFEKNLKRKLPFSEKRNVGFQGENVELDICKNKEGGMWFATRKMYEPTSPEYDSAFSPRYWNAFGFETQAKGSLNITVEINFVLAGINNRFGGLLARDTRTGKYFVMHRGSVGGGREGVGKNAFKDFYNGRWKDVYHDNHSQEAILIANIDDPFDTVRQFVESVRNFKEKIKTGKVVNAPTTDKPLIGFKPEFAGIKSGKIGAAFEYETYHGIVVDELRRHLTNSESDRIEFNTQFIDLGFRQGEKILSLYEVKTSCNRQSIYTGIGQLLIHSSGDKTIKKTLVLPSPKDLSTALHNTLQKLDICLLFYERKGPHVRFYSPR